jgi:hypothetical protein
VIWNTLRLFAHHSDIAASEVRFGYPKLLKGEQVEFQARRDLAVCRLTFLLFVLFILVLG